MAKHLPRHTRSKKRRHANSAMWDSVFKDQPKHVKRYAERNGVSLKEALKHFKSLAKKHKKAKAAAIRAKHALKCQHASRLARKAKRAELNRRHTEHQQNLKAVRIMFARAGSRYSSVDENGKPKHQQEKPKLSVIVNPTPPRIADIHPSQDVRMAA